MYQRNIGRAQISVRVFDFNCRVVDQDANRQSQAAQRHHVDGFAERARTQIDVRMDNGIEMQTINVLRQLPRNNKIISAVKQAAIAASLRTSLMDVRTNID